MGIAEGGIKGQQEGAEEAWSRSTPVGLKKSHRFPCTEQQLALQPAKAVKHTTHLLDSLEVLHLHVELFPVLGAQVCHMRQLPHQLLDDTSLLCIPSNLVRGQV